MELNKIDEVLIRLPTPFLSEFSVFCHPKMLLLWQCDVTTSLYWCETIAKDRVQFISSMVTS